MAYKRLTEEQKTFNKMYRETKKYFEGKDWWDVVLEDEAKQEKQLKKEQKAKAKAEKTEALKKPAKLPKTIKHQKPPPSNNPFAILDTINE